jgi:hypothetical protein
VIHQSIEVGYRVSDITGSEQMYNTLVDLRTGPRFLRGSLSMQSQNHDSLLFDNLFVNSYVGAAILITAPESNGEGYLVRLQGNFRRDQTDFNLKPSWPIPQSIDFEPNLPVTFCLTLSQLAAE